MENTILPEDAFVYFETKGAVFIDVRSKSEYSAGHIPGALNIDIYENHFEKEIGALDKEKTYILNCQTGIRSGRATEYMLTQGFGDARNLVGGFDAWKRRGFPYNKGK